MEPVGAVGVAIPRAKQRIGCQTEYRVNMSGKAHAAIRSSCVCMQGSMAGCMDVTCCQMWYSDEEHRMGSQ